MRRRSARRRPPFHRHASPQVAWTRAGRARLLPGLRLRFDGGRPRTATTTCCGTRSVRDRRRWRCVIFALFGLYPNWWRYVDQTRLTRRSLKAVVARDARARRLRRARAAALDLDRRGTSLTSRPACSCSTSCSRSSSSAARASLVRAARTSARCAASARAATREVLIVGAGDGGQHGRCASCAQPASSAPPRSASSTTTRASGACASTRAQGARHDRASSRESSTSVEPDEVVIAIPSAPGMLRAKVVAACRERGIPVRTLPTVFELLRGRRPARRASCARSRSRTCSAASPVRDGARPRRRLPDRPRRARHRRRRLDRLRALPPDRPRRPRLLVLLDHAEDNLFEIDRELIEERHFTARRVGARRLQGGRADARGDRSSFSPTVVFHAAAYKHVAADGGATRSRRCATTRSPRGVTRRDRRRRRRRALRARLDRQGGQPGDRDGRLEGAGRVGRRGGRRTLPGRRAFAAVRFGNVLGSSGSRGADLPPPDRARRAGDRHRPGDDALLHDDPGGGPAGDPRRRRSAPGGEVFVLEMGEPVQDHRPRART